MKKLISFILTCCLLVTVLPMSLTVSAAETDTEVLYQEGWDVLKGLGIIHYDNLQMEESVTRAEFAQVLADAFHLVNDDVPPVGTSSFGRPEDLTSFNDDEAILDTSFTDVSSDHANYAAIKSVADYGVMKGNGDGTFEPDRVLKYEEAVKTLIVLCGYETEALVKGGWFTGYYKVANNWDLMLANKAIGENLSKIEFAELLYRTFDIALRDVAYIKDGVVYYAVDTGKTFLTERLGFYYAEGQLTEAENSTISAVKTAIDDVVVVDGVTIRNDGASPNTYLGRQVKAFYIKENGANKLVYTRLSRYDKALEIDAEDFAGYANGTISYYVGDTKKTVNVSGYPVIYNGAALAGYDATFLDDFYYGTIVVTQSDSGTNVVNVRSFKDMVVDSIDSFNYSVLDSETGVRLSLNEEDYLVSIFNSGKEKIDFSKLNTGISISYLEGSNCREVYAGPASITATITALNAGARTFDVILNNATVTFKTTKLLAEGSLSSYLNSNVIIYRNTFGHVFRLKANGTANGLKQGVIAAISGGGTIFGTAKVKMFSEDGKFYEYNFADKVVVYTADSSEPKSVDGGYVDKAGGINGYRGYVTYSLNTDGKINELRVPYPCNNEGKALKEDGDGRTLNKKVETNYEINRVVYDWVHIGYSLALDASVKIFAVPSDPTDFDKYAVYSNSQLPSTRSGYNTGYIYDGVIDAYFSDDIDPIPDAVIFHDFTLEGSSNFQTSSLAVVEDVWQELDINGKERTAARVYLTVDYGYYTIYAYPEDQFNGGNWLTTPPLGISASVTDGYTNIYAVNGHDPVNKWSYDPADAEPLEPGDVIMFLLQNGSYEVANLIKFYDADRQNLEGGKPGFLAPSSTGTDKFFINWTEIPQAKKDALFNGEYDNVAQMIQNISQLADGDDLKAQNPSLHYTQYARLVLRDNGYFDYGYKLGLGYVVKNTDAFAYTTTQDLSVPGVVYSENGIPADFETDAHPCGQESCASGNKGVYLHRWEFFTQNNGGLTLIEFDEDGRLTVRRGYPTDIHSYEEYGNNASRLLYNNYNDRPIIINDYRNY